MNKLLSIIGESAQRGMVGPLMALFGQGTTTRLPGEPRLTDPDSAYGERPQLNPWGNDTLSRGLWPAMPRRDYYAILDEMDSTGLAQCIVDMYTDEALGVIDDENAESRGQYFKVHGNAQVRRAVDEMFQRTKINAIIHDLVRAMCLYGSDMPRLVYASGKGVTHILRTDPRGIDIVVDENGELAGYSETGHKYRDTKNKVSWPWDYAHFRIAGKRFFAPYGQSMLVAGIRSWTQMSMAEDAALQYRITRQPDRLKYVIDTGTASEAEGYARLNEQRRMVRRNTVVDPVARRLYQNFEPVSNLDDIFIAKKPGSLSDVELMQGSANVQDVGDLSYYSRKFLFDVGVPPALAGIVDSNGDTYDRKKKTANQDIRFARRVSRVQRGVIEAVETIAKVDMRLVASDLDDPRLQWDRADGRDAFRLSLRRPSSLEEMEQLELMQLRGQIAQEMAMLGNSENIDPYEFTTYILRDVLRLSDNKVRDILRKAPEAAEQAAAQGQPGGQGPASRPQPSPFQVSTSAKRRAAARLRTPKRPISTKESKPHGDIGKRRIQELHEAVRRNPKIANLISRLEHITRDDDASDL